VPEIKCLEVIKDVRSDGTIKIYPLAYLVVVDREEGYYEEKTRVEIDLENDTDEKVAEKIKEALKWAPVSRKRLERAKEIANKFNIPLEVVEDC